MRRYFVISGGGHFFLLALWITSGALLSKPRMSYYAIDLTSSLPAGGSVGSSAAPAAAVEAPKAPPVVERQERKLPAREVIKVKGKVKPHPAVPKPEKKHGLNLKAALAVLDNQGKGSGRGGIPGAAGAGIVADAGPAFPYPWYL